MDSRWGPGNSVLHNSGRFEFYPCGQGVAFDDLVEKCGATFCDKPRMHRGSVMEIMIITIQITTSPIPSHLKVKTRGISRHHSLAESNVS